MIHIDGFEQFAGEQSPAAALQRAEYLTSGQWALVGTKNGIGLGGRQSWISRSLVWTSTKFSTGFAHQFDGRGSVAWVKVGNKVVHLWMNPDTGLPNLNENIGGALPTANRLYYYEIEIDRANGLVSLFINNRFDVSYSIGEVAAQLVEVGLGYVQPSVYRPDVTPAPQDNSTKTFDDFYMRDGARLGPIAVTTRFPGIDKHVEWFRADSTKAHAVSMSMHPPKPLDNYVASNLVGAEDAFTSPMALANDNAIVATGLVVLARKSPTLNAKLGVFIGGDDKAQRREVARTVESDWRTQYVAFERNDSDSVQGITETQFGFNVAAP